MPENTNEQIENEKVETQEQADRKKRTEKRDQSTLVTEAEHTSLGEDDGNFFENRVFDVEELLNTGTEDEINKLNRLKEYGVTDDMIISIYKDMSGHVTTKTAALDTLSTIFDRLVIYISKLPNAIVLDPDTGYIDREASIAQGYEVGIYSNTSELFFAENSNETLIEMLQGDIKEKLSEQISYESYNSFLEYNFLMENFNDEHLKEEMEENIDDSLDKSIEDLRVSDELKYATMRRRENIENSEYEQDPNLYEITSLEIEHANAKEPTKSILKSKIDDFYKNNPSYEGRVKISKNNQGKMVLNGQLNGLSKFENFKNLYKFESIVYQLDRIADLTPEQFEKLDLKDKQVITMALFKGYSFDRNADYKLLADACGEKIKILFPNLDIDKKSKKANRVELANIARDILKIPVEGEELSFKAFYDFNNDKMELATDAYLRKNKESYRNKAFDLQDANLTASYISAVDNFFAGTGIELDENVQQRYDFLYKSYTVNSWLEDKDKAIRLRYMSIQSMKENYQRSPETDYTRKRIAELEKDEKEFWEKYGEDFIRKNGDPKEWSEKKKKYNIAEYNHYKNNKVLAGITNYYTRDMIDFQQGLTYEKMDPEAKKAYIRNSLAIYSMVKDEGNDKNSILAKTVLRRFELMNTDDKKFVTLDENGKAVINEKLIFEEYKMHSSKQHEWISFEELLQASEQKKEKYVVEKLAELCEQPKLQIIGSKQDLDKAFTKITSTKIKLKEERTKEENKKQLTNRDLDSAIKAGKVPVEQLDASAVREAQEKAKKKEVQTREDSEEEGKTVEAKKKDDEGDIDNPNGNNADVNSLDELINMNTQDQNMQLVDTRTLGFFGRVKQIFGKIRDFLFGKRTTNPESTRRIENVKKETKKKEEAKDKKQDKNVNQEQTINDNGRINEPKDFNERIKEGVSQPIVPQRGQSNDSTQSGRSEDQVRQQEGVLKNDEEPEIE